MPILRNLSWGAEESPTASSRAVRIWSPGICSSCRETKFCEVERSRGNVGKCVFCRRITRSRGAELPRKLSGMIRAPHLVVLCDPSRRYSKAGNDSSNNEAHFTNRKRVISISISHIRAGFFSVLKILSASLSDSESRYHIMTGMSAGKKSGVSQIGFVFVKMIGKSRRRGCIYTINLHLLHTCASLYHFHGPDLREESR